MFRLANLNEEYILRAFFDWFCKIYDLNKTIIITKNGKQFDLPFISTRVLKYNAELQVQYCRVLNNLSQLDLQEITKGRVKLDDMAYLMGLETKSSNGLQAIKWFKEGKYKEIEDYCIQDVEVTEQVYLKYKGLTNAGDDDGNT